MIIKNSISNNIKIVIPLHSTIEYIGEFQNILPKDNITFIFDRINKPDNFSGKYKIYNENSNRFLAGKMRNLGISDITSEDVIFFDEDKVPNINPIPIIEQLKQYYDCILFFIENDPRITKFKRYMKLHDIIPLKRYGLGSFVYTCGIYLKNQVIRDIQKLNNGYLFHPAFDGTWGGEDDFLGDEIMALGYKIGFYSAQILKNKVTTGIVDRKNDLITSLKTRTGLNQKLASEFISHQRIEWGKRIIP